jgi:hypothetical protein
MQPITKHLVAAALGAGLVAGLAGTALAAPKKKKAAAPPPAAAKEDPKPAPAAAPAPETKPAPQEARAAEPRAEAKPAAARDAAPAKGGQKGGWGPCLAAYYIGPRAGYQMNDGGKVRTMELLEIVIQPLRIYDAYLAYSGEGWAKIVREENLGR